MKLVFEMTKNRKIVGRQNLTISIIVVLFVGIILAVIFPVVPAGTQSNTVKQISGINNTYRIPNLNITDIISTTHDSAYVQTYTAHITLFSPTLMQLGYLASSSVMFNFTGKINNSVTVPATIASVVFLMKNSSLAIDYVNSMLSSNNASQSIRGYVLNSTSRSNYGLSGKNIYIYTISSVAVFNTSVIGSPDIILPMPDYQYTSIFAYNNAVGTIVINSYTDKLNGTLSKSLAEELAIKMMADKCCAEN